MHKLSMLAAAVFVSSSMAQENSPRSNLALEPYRELLELAGTETTPQDHLERGILVTLARKMHAAYEELDALHLRVHTVDGIRFLSKDDVPATAGLSRDALERLAPQPSLRLVMDWRMTARNEFALQMFRGRESLFDRFPSKKIDVDRQPDWRMVSRYENSFPIMELGQDKPVKTPGFIAVEARGDQTAAPYVLKSMYDGRAPRLIKPTEFGCGLLGPFPYSVVGRYGTELSPRSYWGRIIERGSFDGRKDSASGVVCLRFSSESRHPDGSINRLNRLYLHPVTWRVVQIDELGPAFVGDKCGAIVAMSWRFTEVSTGPFLPETFSFDPLLSEREPASAVEQPAVDAQLQAAPSQP